MAYKIYTDKSELFEAKVSVDGASSVKCRLILESGNTNLFFNGSVVNGKCNINIPKMKKFFEDGINGNIRLEVIADDTYFEPWSDKFSVTQKTKVKVSNQGITEDETPSSEKKAIVEDVKVGNQDEKVILTNKEIVKILKEENVNKLTSEMVSVFEDQGAKISKKDRLLINKALERLNG